MYTQKSADASALQHHRQDVPCACCGQELWGWSQPSWNPAKAPYTELLCKNRACLLLDWSIDATRYDEDVQAELKRRGVRS